MNSKGLDKWFQREVRQTAEFVLESQGITLEIQGLDWETMNNLRKKNTIKQVNGTEIRNEDGLPMDMIASSIKKANGEQFNLYDRDILERIGVKTHDKAINKLFALGEIGELLTKIREISNGTEETEKSEVEELKNS